MNKNIAIGREGMIDDSKPLNQREVEHEQKVQSKEIYNELPQYITGSIQATDTQAFKTVSRMNGGSIKVEVFTRDEYRLREMIRGMNEIRRKQLEEKYPPIY